MPGGERPTVFRRCVDIRPPLGIGRHRERAGTGNGIFQDHIRNQSPAADRTENADTEFPRFGEEHKDDRGQEENQPFFADQRDQLCEECEEAVADSVKRRENQPVIPGKCRVQPAGCCSKFQKDRLQIYKS